MTKRSKTPYLKIKTKTVACKTKIKTKTPKIALRQDNVLRLNIPDCYVWCCWQLVDMTRAKGEQQLNEKRQKVVLELQKVKLRADEFSDYGELNMMQQYVADVRAMQKRLMDVQEQIVWVNKEEGLYKFQLTQFPEVEEISTFVDPYMKLFQNVSKWQRAEKK